MKRFLAVLLVLVMFMSLGACSGSSTSTDSGSSTSTGSSSSTSTGSSTSASSGTEADDWSKPLEMVLMTKDSTASGFADWLKKAEDACNIKIKVIATSTNTETRQSEVTTTLSTGDKNVDIITVNDEMYTAFKNTGWLVDFSDSIMTKDVAEKFPQQYMKDSVIGNEGQIYSVPMYFSALGWFVNTKIAKELGYESISTFDDLMGFIAAATNGSRYGYGGAWDSAYAFNEIGSFVNLWGGDYFDWTNVKTQKGVETLFNICKNGYTTTAQMANKYEQLYQNMIDGKTAICLLYTGNISKFKKAGAYGKDGYIQMITPPVFDNSVGASAYCSSWHYIMNAAGTNQEGAKRFLTYAASEEGQMDYALSFGVFPAYTDLLNDARLDNIAGIDDMRSYCKSVTLRGRPIVPEAAEYINDIGSLFQKMVMNEIDLKTFYKEAQTATEKYK